MFKNFCSGVNECWNTIKFWIGLFIGLYMGLNFDMVSTVFVEFMNTIFK